MMASLRHLSFRTLMSKNSETQMLSTDGLTLLPGTVVPGTVLLQGSWRAHCRRIEVRWIALFFLAARGVFGAPKTRTDVNEEEILRRVFGICQTHVRNIL